jgi:hypothetical protein
MNSIYLSFEFKLNTIIEFKTNMFTSFSKSIIIFQFDQEGCLFSWACLELGTLQAQHARGLIDCQAQSWLGLASARPSSPPLGRACVPENLYL